ncbi:2-isopropylmalate synthase [bacterium HR25]|jgi:2-isopropylmalate synthase|nr:2-isopropylmalate synthase [bacterium HR25]
MTSAQRVLIFDTTLRDGEQTPGVGLNAEEKLEIARALERLRVDIIEAGFPASSPGDFEAVKLIAQEVRGCAIAGLARAVPGDVDACWEAIKHAEHPRIHVFISSSDIHIMHMLERDREHVLEMARTMVARAKKYCPDVEFSPQDATRSDPEYIYRMLTECIEAGATTVNIPDTVGYAIPEEFAQFIRNIQERVPNIHKATISVHCHNDLGLAVANSLAAIRAGARQVEVCVNGIGERGGNASLEEVVMALKTRRDFFGTEIGVDTTQIYRVSRLVSQLTGIPVQPNKAIVGANAFRHQSGIHQHGIVKLRETYEIIDPRDIGLPRGGIIVLNKNSGRHGLKARLQELGYELSNEELDRVFQAFKELADKKGEVDDRDLEALVSEERRTAVEVYKLDLLQVSCGNQLVPTATVRLIGPNGEVRQTTATGTGPVDASFRAIDMLVGLPNRLVEYQVKNVTEGIDAQGEVTVRIEVDGNTYVGWGSDTDIVVASAKALMDALNRALTRAPKERQQLWSTP